MSDNPEAIAVGIERRVQDSARQISELLQQQQAIQVKLSTLLAQGAQADQQKITTLKNSRQDIQQAIALLSQARTDLLDGLPITTTAAGQLDVIGGDLAKDAALLERAEEKLQRFTQIVQQVEGTITKAAGVLKSILL